MKLGIIARTDYLRRIIPGDSINYMTYLLEYFRKKFQIVMFDWRDVSNDLTVSKYVIGDKIGIKSEGTPKKLNELCDFVFIKQLGKIYLQKKQFLSFLESLKNFNGIVLNPPETIKNNFSKKYLLDLQEKGLPTMPTIKLPKDITLEKVKETKFLFRHYSKKPGDYVAKPMNFGEMGASVKRISEFKDNEEFQKYLSKNSPILLQPFIPDILEKGEISFVFLLNKFAHAIKKVSGEFKINSSLQKTNYEPYNPTKEELEICKKISDFWEDELGYWRVDFIYSKGKPLISEVEAANPAFYPENYPKIAEEFTKKLSRFLEEYYESKING